MLLFVYIRLRKCQFSIFHHILKCFSYFVIMQGGRGAMGGEGRRAAKAPKPALWCL